MVIRLRFVIGTIWYNDPSIIRMIESFPKEIPIVIVDGGFDGGISDDELRKKVMSYKNVVLIDCPEKEVRKRQMLLYLCRNFKYCMVVDSDEYLYKCDWEEFLIDLFNLDEGIHHVMLEDLSRLENGKPRISAYGKLMINPIEWEYVKCHNVLRNKKTGETNPLHKFKGKIFENIMLRQDDDMRSKEYMEKHDEYIRKLIRYEEPIRRKYL